MGTIAENLAVLYVSLGIGFGGIVLLLFGYLLIKLASADREWVGEVIQIIGGSCVICAGILGGIASAMLLILYGHTIVLILIGALLVIGFVISLLVYVMRE